MKTREIQKIRFLGNFEQNSIGCWLWLASPTVQGYGRAWWGNKQIHSHRISYEIYKGPIPKGLQIDHVCRNRLCVNPAHLEAVTQRENLLRGNGACAVNARKKYCKKGHEYTPENTYIVNKNDENRKFRRCKTCAKARNKVKIDRDNEELR